VDKVTNEGISRMSNQIANTPESELLVVQEAARLITKSSDPLPAVQGILRLLSQLLGLNRGRVLLPDDESQALTIRYAYGLTGEERERGRYQIGEGITGRVYQTGQLAVIQDIDDEPTYLGRAVERTTLPDEAVAYLAVPVIQEEQPIGVLAVHRLRNRVRPFQRDLALLQVIATFIAQVLRVQQLIDEHTAELKSENDLLRINLQSHGARYGIIGQSPALQQAIQQTLQVAATNTTVLLLGESGTGKEKFARMQHLAGERSDGPFVSINCAAIPKDLIESELFGHEKGAFTGANAAKRGKIELASGGTLFLDEIGDLDLDLQAKLLKVLEERHIQRVGGVQDVPVDVRVVAATHKNLQQAVNDNRFRLDLFYRLNVFPIRLPSLRERAGDVSVLAAYFLQRANEEYGRQLRFGTGVLARLEAYHWPGNIRQLENLVKRAVLLSTEQRIDTGLIEDILAEEQGVHMPGQSQGGYAMRREEAPAMPASTDGLRPYARVREDEVELIRRALHQHQGNKTRAAMSLGMTPRQLRYRIQKLAIEAP
jgi:Nif-specific regulatory protein